MLPASDGTDGELRGEVDELAETAAAMEAVLVEEDPAHNLAELFRDKYTDEVRDSCVCGLASRLDSIARRRSVSE